MRGNLRLSWMGYLLIALLPVLIFLTSITWLLNHMQEDMHHSELQLKGLYKVRGLYEVLTSLQRVRGLDSYASQQVPVETLNERRDQELQQLQAYLTLMLGEDDVHELGIYDPLQRLKQRIAMTAETEWQDSQQRFVSYTQLIWGLQDMISLTGDLSRVTAESASEMHFYTDSYVSRLPWLTEAVGRLRGQTSLLLRDELSDEQRFELRYLIEQLQDITGRFTSSHQSSMASTLQDQQYSVLAEQLVTKSIRYTNKLLGLLESHQHGVRDLTLFDEGSELIELTSLLHQQSFLLLKELFQQKRSEKLYDRNLLIMLNVFELIAIYGGLFWAYRSNSLAFRRLKSSEYFLQRVLNTIPARVFWKDKDLNYLGCNALFADDAGLNQPEHVIGRDDFAMPWQAQAEHYRADDQTVMSSGKAKLHYEERQHRSDGGLSWVETSKIPLENDGGEIIGVLGVYQDITERKQAELALVMSELRLRSVVDTMADALITIDQHGVVQGFNAAAEQIFGYRAVEVIGQNVQMLMPAPYRSEHDGYIKNYLDSRKARVIGKPRELVACRSNGEIFPVELALAEVNEEGGQLFSGIVRDLTEQKRNERLKSEFVSTVSHELRTPLTSVRGSLGLLKSGVTGELSDQAQKLVDIAYSNTDRLVMLINDILDIQKIEADQVNIDIIAGDVNKLIAAIVKDSQNIAQQYGVNFKWRRQDVGLKAMVDVTSFNKIMSNLLSNAAKFSPQGETVTIRAVQHSQKTIRVSVEDHGPGIPFSLQDKLYEKFTQGDSSDTRDKGGTGLGMAIVKALTEKMGGKVGFSTAEGVGTTFYIDLRVA